MKRGFLLILFVSILISNNFLLAGSPFKARPSVINTQTEFSLKTSIMQWINESQQKLRRNLTMLVTEIRDSGYSSAVFLLIGFSFLYGFIHALGPGHGKVIVMSYMLSEKRSTLLKGVMMGFVIAFGEALSAIIVVYSIFYFALGRISSETVKVENMVRTIGYSAVFLIGISLLVFRIIKQLRQPKPQQCNPDSDSNHSTKKSGLGVAISLAIIPCPGVMILLIFMLTMKMPYLGIFLALIMAFGMSITISIFGLFISYSKVQIVSSVSGGSKHMECINSILEIAGALLIILLSGYMLLG